MFNFLRAGLAAALLTLPAAQAQSAVQVSVRPIQGGVELDGGSGPKQFVCAGDLVTSVLNVSGRKLSTRGKHLTLTMDLADQHLSFETHDQKRPLAPNQVRLTCAKGVMKSQAGRDIEVVEGE
jgi:hypothetical protein